MPKASYSKHPTSEPRFRRALEQVRPEMAALPQKRLRRLNVDPLLAVSTVTAALPRLFELAPQLTQSIPAFDIELLNRLESYALAFMQTHTVFVGIDDQPERLMTVSKAANALRIQLLSDVEGLANRGIIPRPRLLGLKGANGHRNIASDLLTLSALLRDSWSVIANKTPVSAAELDQAEILGDELILAIGLRETTTEQAAQAAHERQQAFTLFVQAYDEVRDIVAFARRLEGDAEQIAPSLYTKQKKARKKKAASAPESEPALKPELAPEPTTAQANEAAPAAEPAPVKIRVGLPGSDPFLH